MLDVTEVILAKVAVSKLDIIDVDNRLITEEYYGERRLTMQSNETRHRECAARIWLEYFNRKLRDGKAISESEYLRMASQIYAKYPDKRV